jgi:hypothetical protein
MEPQETGYESETEKGAKLLPCHKKGCGCPDWKDQSGFGECENKNPLGVICQHPIESHYAK